MVTAGAMRMAAILRGVLPRFVRVTTWGLLGLRTGWPWKFRASTESFTCVPVPLK